MATLVVKPVPHTGLVLASSDLASATSGGDKAPTGQGLFLYVTNGDSGSHTVTVATPGTVDGLAVGDRAVVIAAGDFAFIPMLEGLYKDPSDGLAHITYDAVTSVKVAAVRVPLS